MGLAVVRSFEVAGQQFTRGIYQASVFKTFRNPKPEKVGALALVRAHCCEKC
jgi:hypothetical protein